tara:strand:- start:8794 stop:8976 length:183 start_codon:yes stop_codon:yes gene_type:complete
MDNIFGKNNMFATPDSIEAMQRYVNKFSGQELVIAMTIMGMTWNLAHEELAKVLKKEEAR